MDMEKADHSNGHLESPDEKQHREVPEDGWSENDWDAQEEKKLVRKLDLRVFPMLCIVFGLSLLDRANMGLAYIAGMETDLALDVGSRYNIALLVFFIGYFIFEIPSNYVIRRIGAKWWLSFLITVWGLCALGMGTVENWQALAGLRAALGVFEAGLFPGALFIISAWYKQYEIGVRIQFFWMISQLMTAFGPIFAYALSLISVGDGIYTQGWRWIFLVEGGITIAAGLVSPFFLVEFPERVKFLTERQRHIALERLRLAKEANDIVHPTVMQSVKILMDWKIGLYCILYFIAASSVYSIAYFFPTILRDGLGFSYTKAQLLQTPPYVCTIILAILMGRVSDKIKMRWPVVCFQALMAVTGLLIILYAKPNGARYFGLFVASYGIQSNVPGTISYAQSQIGLGERKGIASAAVVSAGAIGGICGSTIFRPADAPDYIPGMWGTIGMQLFYAVVVFCLSMHFKRQNRLADEGIKPVLEDLEGFRYAP